MVCRVAIVGCGLIGTQWDAGQPDAAYSLTHAAGFSKHPGAELAALCDQDGARAREAAATWGAGAAYDDVGSLFARERIDIAVAAASSAARWSIVEPALAAGVKVLVIEKPLATTLDESRRLAAAVKAAGCASIVNFSRRWDPAMQDLRERIAAGAFGAVQRFNASYGKGIGNNGSHMIDLVAFLGGGRPVRARSLGSPLDLHEADWSQGRDHALDAQVEYEDGAGKRYLLTLLGTDQRAFTLFELRVLGSKALFDMRRGGRELSSTPLQADPNYAGYIVPGAAQPEAARLLEAMDRMVDEAVQLAAGQLTRSRCDVDDALRTALAVEAINLSAQADGEWIAIDALAGASSGEYRG